jgi:hypothetical protein
MSVAFSQRQRARSRVRVSSRGFDPTLCGIDAGPGNLGGDLLAAGLRVPYNPTGAVSQEIGYAITQPYLFQLATIGVGAGLWVTGLGQLSILGLEQLTGTTGGDEPVPGPPVFPNVIQQQTAAFRFADCRPIRWGLRQVRKPTPPWTGNNVLSTSGFAWRWSENPALVYETATFPAGNLNWKGTPDNYLTLETYFAPCQANKFPGRPVGGDLGDFESIDFPWQNPNRKAFDPIWIDGGGYLVFYAWVDQTNTETRAAMVVPEMFPLATTGMPENAFIADWDDTIQYAVGGWIEVEHSSDRTVDADSPCAVGIRS